MFMDRAGCFPRHPHVRRFGVVTESSGPSISPSSGSSDFDRLRDELARDTAFRHEVERALHVNVNRVNPSDPGNRFVTGGAVEWIIAAAAWHVGVLTVPGGHSERGFDLLDLQSSARSLWSVKSQTAKNKSAFRISNGLGGGGKGFSDPTIFLSPHLPGLVYADPMTHLEVKKGEQRKEDAVTIAFGVISKHADAHPECVAPLTVARNEQRGHENPFLAYTQTILVPEQFPLMSEMFTSAKPVQRSVSDEVHRLAELRDQGSITQEQFNDLIKNL